MTRGGQSGAESGWDAFLSYAWDDVAAARRVQRFLERYRLPDARRLKVYRDETDIASGKLPEQLREALEQSSRLVVCCSNAAAQSDWVNREIEIFRQLTPPRPIILVLVGDDPTTSLPPSLREPEAEIRWSDLRKGWRLGFPCRETRVELVRVVAAVAGLDFRELLPLDRRRRRRNILRATAAFAFALLVAVWFPVLDWADITPDGRPVVGCDTLDDGIALFQMNEPQAIKNIVSVRRDAFGLAPDEVTLGPDLLPRGRLLPQSVGGQLRERCGGSWEDWVGEPEAGTCVGLSRSAKLKPLVDHMGGGGDAPLTDAAIDGEKPFTLDMFWRRINHQRWEDYGSRMHPSNGLPVSVTGSDIWLGFPDGEFFSGRLWHTTDKGQSWEMEEGISEVRSVRQLSIGVLIAARRDRELGFYLRRKGVFEAFDVPGKGDQLEVCGELDGQPVIRVDRKVFRRVQRPWWHTRFDQDPGVQ